MPGAGMGDIPVSNHAHVVAKWKNCERMLKMFSIRCDLDLEKSQFNLFKEVENSKNKAKPQHERDYTPLAVCGTQAGPIDTVRELECFLVAYEEGRTHGFTEYNE